MWQRDKANLKVDILGRNKKVLYLLSNGTETLGTIDTDLGLLYEKSVDTI